jgi:hypothetical protein
MSMADRSSASSCARHLLGGEIRPNSVAGHKLLESSIVVFTGRELSEAA